MVVEGMFAFEGSAASGEETKAICSIMGKAVLHVMLQLCQASQASMEGEERALQLVDPS